MTRCVSPVAGGGRPNNAQAPTAINAAARAAIFPTTQRERRAAATGEIADLWSGVFVGSNSGSFFRWSVQDRALGPRGPVAVALGYFLYALSSNCDARARDSLP